MEKKHLLNADQSYIIARPSSAVLPARRFGDNDSPQISSHFIKQEDIETECEDNAELSSDSSECDNLKNVNHQLSSETPLSSNDFINNSNVKVKQEPEDSGYKHVGLSFNDSQDNFINSHHNVNEKLNNYIKIKEEPKDSGYDNVVGLSKSSPIKNLNQVSNTFTQNTSNAFIQNQPSSTVEQHTSGISKKHESTYIFKPLSDIFNIKMDIFETDLFFSGEENEFPSNYIKHLYLNFDYDKKNVVECLKYFRLKHHASSTEHELFKKDSSKSYSSNSTSCTDNHIICKPASQGSNISAKDIPLALESSVSTQQLRSVSKMPLLKKNGKYSVIPETHSEYPISSTQLSVQKPEIETKKLNQSLLKVNSVSTSNIGKQASHTIPQFCDTNPIKILSDEDFHNIKKFISNFNSQCKNKLVENTSLPVTCTEEICKDNGYKSFNVGKLKSQESLKNVPSTIFETPDQHSEQVFLENTNVLSERKNLQNQMKNHFTMNQNLSTLQTHHNVKINPNKNLALNQPSTLYNNLTTKGINNEEREIELQPSHKKIKLTNPPFASGVNTKDTIRCNNLNTACVKPPISVAANLLKNAKSLNEMTDKEYIQHNTVLPRDPRLRKNSVTKASSISTPLHLSVPSLTKQVQIDNSPIVKNSNSSIPKDPRIHRIPKPVDEKNSVKTKKNFPTCDLFYKVIAWETKWLYEKYKTNQDPKCIETCKEVKNNYQSFAEYQDTYHPLLLFILWLNLYEAWMKQSQSYKAQLKECEEKSHYYKSTCVAIMPSTDILTKQSIIYISFKNAKYEHQCLFGYVYEVEAKPTRLQNEILCKQVRFLFLTREKLDVMVDGTIKICKLLKIRVAHNQYNALSSFEFHPMRDIILNPNQHATAIQVCSLNLTTSHAMQSDTDKIVDISLKNKFTLVLKESTERTLLYILKLVRGFLVKRRTILVCLYDIKMLFEFANLLISSECSEIVLGIKEGDISVPQSFQKYTLRSYASQLSNMSLEKAELEVLKNSRIILTELSSIFLSDIRNGTLGQNLTCIIVDAHLITEAETAVPLSFRPNNVVMIGNPKLMNDKCKKFNYNKSFFHRLLEENRSKIL